MFAALNTEVQRQFALMAESDLFVVQMDKDELFKTYLNALPAEEVQSHTCNACRQFLNNYGALVAIINNEVRTMWDFSIRVPEYAKVPKALRQLILSKVIEKPFLTKIDKLGIESNRQRLEDGKIIRWNHFAVTLPSSRLLRSPVSIEEAVGDKLTTRQVFSRGLTTLTLEAADTILELIEANSLYRGAEFKPSVVNFRKHKRQYDALATDRERELYTWQHYADGGRIRNSPIGTLLKNLSEDMPVDAAVRAFETNVVAPATYQRPTSLVTASMVKKAQEEISELGYAESLARRHATADDVPVNHMLYVNRKNAKQSVFDEVTAAVAVNPKTVKCKEITLDVFLAGVLPGASSLELLLEGSHNFVSLIAPEDPDTANMFAWDNALSWTYQNNMTDVVKEKVKNAGGSVDGELRISLEWWNYDDLDLHVVEPGGCEISFRNKRSYATDGYLDVDMNAGAGTTREPVENVSYASRPEPGVYRVVVHNFARRETTDVGFNVQIECRSQGTLLNLNYPRAVQDREQVEVARFKYSKKEGITDVETKLTNQMASREVNGLRTNLFHKVRMAMYSPNHWTNNVGNKHLFFILEGARIDDKLRPFFNEYLNAALTKHRKVFEVLGSKLMIEPANDQLTGVGLSLTQKSSVVVKVNNVVYRVLI